MTRLAEPLEQNAPAPLDDDDARAIRDAIASLPLPQRQLVMLVHWDGFTLAQAAEICDVNPSTARSRYATARATLREVLEAQRARA